MIGDDGRGEDKWGLPEIILLLAVAVVALIALGATR